MPVSAAPRTGTSAFKCYETQSPLGLPPTTPCSGADATALYTRARLPLCGGRGARCDAPCDEEGAEVRGRGVDGGDVGEDDGGRDGGDVVLVVAARGGARGAVDGGVGGAGSPSKTN